MINSIIMLNKSRMTHMARRMKHKGYKKISRVASEMESQKLTPKLRARMHQAYKQKEAIIHLREEELKKTKKNRK